MTRITTADEARDYINTAIARTSWEEIHGLVVQWNNTTDNYIDANGDVWVEKPQTGRWLDNDSLVEFANSWPKSSCRAFLTGKGRKHDQITQLHRGCRRLSAA